MKSYFVKFTLSIFFVLMPNTSLNVHIYHSKNLMCKGWSTRSLAKTKWIAALACWCLWYLDLKKGGTCLMATSVNEMYNTEDRRLRWAEHGSNPRAVYLIDAAILCKGSLLSVQLSDAWTQHVTGEAHSGSFYNHQLFIVLSQYLVEVTFSDGESAEVVVCCSYFTIWIYAKRDSKQTSFKIYLSLVRSVQLWPISFGPKQRAG